jgi:hypothetical protein
MHASGPDADKFEHCLRTDNVTEVNSEEGDTYQTDCESIINTSF